MGYSSIEQVDAALRERIRFRKLITAARDNVHVELHGSFAIDPDAPDPAFDALLDARLSFMHAAERAAAARVAVAQIAAATRVQ